ncbi:MAG: hypothetical protein R6U41_02635 [Desulfosalsimonas sp.]|uniref:hypothetical protein n=1 Tax=Desulfosalsimonas sp. TaxID=3073848 RepID=UPI0039706B97
MSFRVNRRFRKDYKKLFKKNPETANLFLLLCELADQKGRVITDETELVRLMAERFQDPREYQL